ncbi:MAG: hypothetical protein ACLGJB_18075 [Blastocatellia bacterium]
MTRRLLHLTLPLTTFALWLAVCHVGYAARGIQSGAPQKRRVVLRGRLTGTREIQQVVTWQTPGPKSTTAHYGQAHLAVETTGPGRRTIWETAGAQSQHLVDTVQSADLDGDGTPEIISLWRPGASAGASLRVFHWDRDRQSFIELQYRDSLDRIHDYRITGGGRAARSSLRIVAYMASDSRAGRLPRRGEEFEVRGSELVRVGGGEGMTTQGESGIVGQAVISPVRPGPIRVGQARNEQPFKTTLVISTAAEGREVARLETGPDGRFRVSLPPGEYKVGPPPGGARFLPRASEQFVKVLPGQFAQVTINFDSGMR